PLFVHAKDTAAGTETTAVGIGYYRSQKNGWDFGLLPLVFAGRHGDEKYGVGFPLYVYRGDKTSSTHVLGPLYASKSDNGYAGGLAPIIHSGKRSDATGVTHASWILPPLYLHTDDSHTDSSFSMIALAFHSHSGKDRTSGIFPLVWDVDRGEKHAFVVFPFGARFVDDEQKTKQ